jgi:hypothetical protein
MKEEHQNICMLVIPITLLALTGYWLAGGIGFVCGLGIGIPVLLCTIYRVNKISRGEALWITETV